MNRGEELERWRAQWWNSDVAVDCQMDEPSGPPRDPSYKYGQEQQQHGGDMNSNTIRLRGLDLQDGELGKSHFHVWVVVTRAGGDPVDVQLDRMIMAVQRFMVDETMEVRPQPLHQQERQCEAPNQRTAAR